MKKRIEPFQHCSETFPRGSYARKVSRNDRRWRQRDGRTCISQSKESCSRKKRERKNRWVAMFPRDWSSVEPRSERSFVVLENCLESKHVRVLLRMDENRYLNLSSREKLLATAGPVPYIKIYRPQNTFAPLTYFSVLLIKPIYLWGVSIPRNGLSGTFLVSRCFTSLFVQMESYLSPTVFL